MLCLLPRAAAYLAAHQVLLQGRCVGIWEKGHVISVKRGMALAPLPRRHPTLGHEALES